GAPDIPRAGWGSRREFRSKRPLRDERIGVPMGGPTLGGGDRGRRHGFSRRRRMIARFWTAKTSRARAPVYADHLKNDVLATLNDVDGYVGAKLLERETADGVEIVVISFWRSLDSIRKFAGEDIEKAVVSDKIAPLLLSYDQCVRHYEVVVEDDV